jgi:hypothetical protein
MNDILIKALYKVGHVWEKYNLFPGASKKSENSVSIEKLIANTYCPAPYMSFVYKYGAPDFDYTSPSVKEILGYDSLPTNWDMESLMSLFPPDDYEKFIQKEVTSLTFAQKQFKVEDIFNYKLVYTMTLRKSDGSYIDVLHQGIPLATNAFGQITHLLCIQIDMSHFDYYDDEDISFISLNKDYPSYHSINKWADYETGAHDEYSLTERQLEILTCISEGKKGKDIAAELGVSVETVKTHRKEMLERSGKTSMYELLSDAIDKGILKVH